MVTRKNKNLIEKTAKNSAQLPDYIPLHARKAADVADNDAVLLTKKDIRVEEFRAKIDLSDEEVAYLNTMFEVEKETIAFEQTLASKKYKEKRIEKERASFTKVVGYKEEPVLMQLEANKNIREKKVSAKIDVFLEELEKAELEAQLQKAIQEQIAADEKFARSLSQPQEIRRTRVSNTPITPAFSNKKRARKEAPSTTSSSEMFLPEEGMQISLYWIGDKRWYTGTVLRIDPDKQQMLVYYSYDNTWYIEPYNNPDMKTCKLLEKQIFDVNRTFVDPDGEGVYVIEAGTTNVNFYKDQPIDLISDTSSKQSRSNSPF